MRLRHVQGHCRTRRSDGGDHRLRLTRARNVGPWAEAIYKECLLIELKADGHEVERSRKLRLVYKGHDLKTEFWPDIVVDDSVVVELKAIEKVAPVHKAQVITYLKLTGLPVGLLMNFNVPLLHQGVSRLVRPDLLLRT